MRLVYLGIESWKGISIGAIHCYGRLQWNANNGNYKVVELSHKLTAKEAKELRKIDGEPGFELCWKAGMWTERFNTKEEIIEIALATYKTHVPDGVLVLGSSATLQPQLIIDGPQPYKDLSNKLYEQAKKLDFCWDNYLNEMNEICKKWDELNKKWLNRTKKKNPREPK